MYPSPSAEEKESENTSDSDDSSTIDENDRRLIIVANRAPLRQGPEGWVPSIGGLATALLPVLERQGGVWISTAEDDTVEERQLYPEDEPTFAVRRISLTEDEMTSYYDGMANQALWPVSHYMLQHLELERSFIDVYREINQRFAQAVVDEYEEGAYIWIQDYHLMLVPDLVRRSIPDAMIAHFWHIPWPAMEVFRILPWARELIRGLLGCSLIGFHVEEYVENFLESARVLLGATIKGNCVHWEGREIRVEAHPIGIDVDYFKRMADSDAVIEMSRTLRADAGTDFLVIGIDRLDYTKGVFARLLAFEDFLHKYEEFHERVTFIQVATPSRTDVESYQQLKREVDEAVGRINGAFARGSWTPVRYHYQSFSQEELCAFYRAADAALITLLRDGMNLVTQEFVAATNFGVLVLSELTGAAYIMPEAIKVNPYDKDGVRDAIKLALQLPSEEKQERLILLKSRVEALDVHNWAENFMSSMKKAAYV